MSKPKKLALHTCCAPCSTVFLPELIEEGQFQPVVFYANDNIDTEEEYDKRLAVVREYAQSLGVAVVAKPYDHQAWQKAVVGLEGAAPLPESERGSEEYQVNLDRRRARCAACYDLRLSQTAQFAKAYGIKVMGSTLAVSPYQFVDEINAILLDVAKAYRLKAAPCDLRDRYHLSIERSRALHMYRQNYCGCEYSKAEAESERQVRKAARQAAKAALKPGA
ncbi:MAG: epoxyqueuosine reductase QueH [Coriobacteriales bacterium]|jgi:predicted adenine nucleotide alpha hydrolase (AANH) superfamily ATPase|nr:epoxyqueuosine reductase QueH [Coriobacteriales bacterium]